MMERICEQRASICAALVDVKRLDLMLQSDDIKIIEKIIQILQPFFRLQKVLVGKAMVPYHQSGLFFITCLMML